MWETVTKMTFLNYREHSWVGRLGAWLANGTTSDLASALDSPVLANLLLMFVDFKYFYHRI